MLTPGPDHPIALTPASKRWRASFHDHVVADTEDALIVEEANYPAVVYFPRDDVAMEYMSRTERVTHCPYKGEAAYYTLDMDGQIAENVVWTYEHPFPALSEIEGRLAFYADRVEVYEVDDTAVNPRHRPDADERAHVDAVVQHTDSGSGAPQRELWAPTVETPANDDSAMR
jgi:uncharacterized protein (DUF427 family)